MKTPQKLILASQSPRRRELLEMLGWHFTIEPSSFEEQEAHASALELAIHNAVGKAREVAKAHTDALVLGVDTVVAVDDHQLGKPKDQQDHMRILKLLSGSTHQVISALCLINCSTGEEFTESVSTTVYMDELTEEEMQQYISSGEGEDKAAGYAIQGLGSQYISKIEGDYFNVVGLPINRLKKMLENLPHNT